MSKRPQFALMVLAVPVVVVGVWMSTAPVRCRGQVLAPSESCRFGGTTERTYASLAAEPIRQLSSYLIVAGVLVLASVVIGLLRRETNLPRKGIQWSSTSWSTLIGLAVLAVGMIPLGLFASSRQVTCGGKVMRPGDRCVSYSNGTEASAEDLAGAPIMQLWLYLAVAAILVAVAAILLLRRRGPTEHELADYVDRMADQRTRLVTGTPLGRSTDVESNVATFDRQLSAEVARFGRLRQLPSAS